MPIITHPESSVLALIDPCARWPSSSKRRPVIPRPQTETLARAVCLHEGSGHMNGGGWCHWGHGCRLDHPTSVCVLLRDGKQISPWAASSACTLWSKVTQEELDPTHLHLFLPTCLFSRRLLKVNKAPNKQKKRTTPIVPFLMWCALGKKKRNCRKSQSFYLFI